MYESILKRVITKKNGEHKLEDERRTYRRLSSVDRDY